MKRNKKKGVSLYASIIVMTLATLTLVVYFMVVYKYNNASKSLDAEVREAVLNTYEDYGYDSYVDERFDHE